jgi:two-component system, OmpR family, response regulator
VLVAEDDSTMREILCETLQNHGFEVQAAADGQEALERHATHGPFDVFLMDEDMPRLRGREVLVRLRSQGVQTPAVFLTSASISIEERQELGIRQLLNKPVPGIELVEALRRACRTPGPGSDEAAV